MVHSILVKKELVIALAIAIWIIYFIFKMIIHRKNIDKNLLLNIVMKLPLAIYLSLLIGLTLFPISIPQVQWDVHPVINLNLLSLFNYGFNKYAFVNIVGNILIFSPLPVLMSLNGYNIFSNIKKVIFFSFIISLSIEISQYLEAYFKIIYFARATDIIDIFLNVIGGILGYYAFKIYQKSINKKALVKV